MTVLMQELGHPNGKMRFAKKRVRHVNSQNMSYSRIISAIMSFHSNDASVYLHRYIKNHGDASRSVDYWRKEGVVRCLLGAEISLYPTALCGNSVVYSCDSRNDVHNQVKVGTLNSQSHRNYRNSVRCHEFF